MGYSSIFGGVGTGKTLLMVILSFLSNKKRIIANFHIKIPEFFHNSKTFELISIDKFIHAEYSDCIILLDEIYMYLESRLSHNDLNMLMSYILFQSRKMNVELYGTAQLLSTIDKRFRSELMNSAYILCEANYKYDENGKKQLNWLKYKVFSSSGKLIKILFFEREQVDWIFQYYDTLEIIQRKDLLKGNKYETGLDRKSNNTKFANEIIQYYAQLSIEKNLISKDRVAKYCRENDIDESFVIDIYQTIKDLVQMQPKKKKTKKSK